MELNPPRARRKIKKKKRRIAAKTNIFDDEKVSSQHTSSSLSSNGTKKRRIKTREEKIKSLDGEGAILAEKGAFGKAIGKWNQALQMCSDGDDEAPLKAVLYEQCSQVYLELGRSFDAVVQAHKAVENDSTFVHGYVSLARAQLNLGEPYMALSTMQKALLLDPTTPALWKEFKELKRNQRAGEEISTHRQDQPGKVDQPKACTDDSIQSSKR